LHARPAQQRDHEAADDRGVEPILRGDPRRDPADANDDTAVSVSIAGAT
jgi:hypothetical protein